MNRPILVIVIGYIIGIIWGLYFKTSIVLLFILLLVIYQLLKLILKYIYLFNSHEKIFQNSNKKQFKLFSPKRYFRYLKLILKFNLILTIIISSFVSNSILRYYNKKYDELYLDGENLEIEAIVVSNKIEKEYYNRYKIKVTSSKYKNTYLYVNTKEELEYGDIIKVNGEFLEPEVARNFGGFDYKEYLKTLKIYGTVKAKQVEIEGKKHGIMKISNSFSLKIKSNIKSTYNEKASAIILGVMLGDTSEICDETKDDFSESNISHVLAVSGMHVSYIILLVTKSTQKILGKRNSKIIASIILIIYMFITGFSVSVVRACIMGILNCMAFIVYRKSNTLNNIAISALIILINNPFSLESLSFLLTYGGTLGIIYFKPTVEKIIKSVKVRHRKWKYVILRIQRKYENIIDTISVSISAQLIIAPVMMLKYNTIGISFLITNLLLSFVIGFIVMGGFIQIVISFFSIKIGCVIAKIIQVPVYSLILISKTGTVIPFGNVKIITPDLYLVILYYLIIILFKILYQIFHSKYLNLTEIRVKNIFYLIKYKIKPYKKKIKFTLVIVILLGYAFSKIPHDLRIYFIDVGQGDSCLVVTPNNKKILIDGGGSTTYDIGENTLLPYLLDRKIKMLDYVIVSHFDYDHVRWNFDSFK